MASYLPFTYFIVEVTELNAYLSPSVANSRFFRADVGSKCATLVAVNAITDLDARRFRCLVCVPYSVAGFVMRLVHTSVGSRGDAGGCWLRSVPGGSCAIGFILRLRTGVVFTQYCFVSTHSVGDHTVLFTSLMDVRSSNRFCCRTFGERAKTDAFWRCKHKDTQTS